MRIDVKNVDLSRELNLLEKIVGRKPTIPVLSNVLIRAHEGGVMLAATDLELALIGACEAVVHEPGAVTLPARKLMELVRAQSGDVITLSRDQKGARLECGRFTSRLQALPVDDFPSLATSEGLPSVTLERSDFQKVLTHTRYAVSDKDTKYFLKGAVLTLTGDTMKMVSTDSMRIAVSELPWTTEAGAPVIIPTATMDELLLLLNEPGEGDVVFARGPNHLFFDVDARLLISRMIDGKFPNYEKFIPHNNDKRATINRIMFLEVVKRLVLIAKVVLLKLKPNALDLSAVSREVGDGLETIPVEYDGPEIEIRLNGIYIQEALTASSSDSIVLALQDAQSPALLVDGGYLSVVMGMRV